MTAILFGSISTLADTSELQRSAFNRAFARHGLGWEWGVEEYRSMLAGNGGAARIASYADERGETVDAAAVHATKSALFQQSLPGAATPRPGVVECIARAKETGTKVAFVTTTSPDNVDALLAALAPGVRADDFDLVLTSAQVGSPKPDPAAYAHALRELGEEPGDCVAVEDNPGGARSAVAAGVRCVAFPNENTHVQAFEVDGAPLERTDRLDLDDLLARTGTGSTGTATAR